jgi:hypothetical protein
LASSVWCIVYIWIFMLELHACILMREAMIDRMEDCAMKVAIANYAACCEERNWEPRSVYNDTDIVIIVAAASC